MNRLDQAIDERVSFIEEQINPLVNRALEIQIDTIRNVGTGNIALQILQKQKPFENAMNMDEIE